MMMKYDFDHMFNCLAKDEKIKHWPMFRDSLAKVMNVQREFRNAITTIESLSNYRLTLRAGGQNLRARQLSEIRIICRNLGVSCLHDHMCEIDVAKLCNVKRYIFDNRVQLAELFEYKNYVSDSGAPFF